MKMCDSATKHNGHVLGCEKQAGHKGYHKAGFHAWQTEVKVSLLRLIKPKQKFYLETDKGEKIECKCANHCLCTYCCIERRKINNMQLHQGVKFVYFPRVEKCPYGSNFKERYSEDVKRWEKQETELHEMCDKITLLLKGQKESDL